MQKNTRPSGRSAIALLLGAWLAGCFPVLPTRFVVLEASRKGSDVEFTSVELEKECPSGVLIFGLSVLRKDCDRSCEQWDLVRRDRAAPADVVTPFPVRYGSSIPYTEVIKTARPLEPGVYSISAEMGCFIDGELLGERVFGRFEIPVGGGAIRKTLALQDP